MLNALKERFQVNFSSIFLKFSYPVIKNAEHVERRKGVLKNVYRNSLEVQWLGLHAFTAKDTGSIPGRGTKIPQAMRCSQKKKKGLIKSFFFQSWP